jgi:hypothetical protein
MKYSLSCILLVFILFHSLAQPAEGKDNSTPSLSALKTVVIRLGDGSKEQPSRGTFSHFVVIDARSDTARIGIHAESFTLGASRNRQLVLSGTASASIAAYLNDHFASPGAPFTALVVVRTLWLSDANYIHEDFVKDPDIGQDRTKIRLKAEIYAVKGAVYTPLYRYDSLQVSQKGVYNRFGKDLAGMLDDLADSSGIVAESKWEAGRKLSLDDILQFNQSRLDVAISKDDTLAEGVYADFEEFKNNAPSIHDYEIKKIGKKNILYLKDPDGHSYYSHTAWGYCSGKTIYVMKEGMLEPARKEGKTWYFFSDTDTGADLSSQSQYNTYYDPMTGLSTSSGPPLFKSDQQTKHIFAVDMDTGNAY